MFIDPNWQTINNKKLGVFYIEPYDKTSREEPDKVQIYDSTGTLFSYVADDEWVFPLSLETYNKIITHLQKAKNIIDALDFPCD